MGMHHVGPCITTLTDGQMKETIERGEERHIYIFIRQRGGGEENGQSAAHCTTELASSWAGGSDLPSLNCAATPVNTLQYHG